MLNDVQRAIASRPPDRRLVFLSDYDGTLADFHPDPTVPMLSPARRDLLCTLAHRSDLTVGLVSGRRIVDLRTRTQLPSQAYLAGLHGMEIEVDQRRWKHPDLDASHRQVQELFARLEWVRDEVPGLLLEDKDVSLAVHVRGVAPELREAALARVATCAAPLLARKQLRRLDGALVVEYLPNIACHKGDATKRIARDVESRHGARPWIVFVGDDVTDEDAFRAIDSGVGVLVGSRPSAARYQLSSSDEVEALLKWIAGKDNPADTNP
jgi:trehalose 6-phosphate phosphatase